MIRIRKVFKELLKDSLIVRIKTTNNIKSLMKVNGYHKLSIGFLKRKISIGTKTTLKFNRKNKTIKIKA